MDDILITLELIIDEEIELELTDEPAVNILPLGRPILIMNPFDEELTDLILYYNISKL